MKQSELLLELISTSKQLNARAAAINKLSLSELSNRPKADAWNALECFEHLNLYIDIYNKFFEESLQNAAPIGEDKLVKSGFFGKKFIKMMEPKADGIKKINTFKSKNPIHNKINQTVIDHFILSNNNTIYFLEKSKVKDIQSVNCKLALPILKIKLSDAYQFIIAHNKRHMLQIERSVK